MRLTLVLLAAIVLAGLVAWPLVTRSRAAVGVPPQVAGPFTVEARVRRISTGAFPNTSGNPFATRPLTEYVVRLHGKTVSVPLDGGESEDRFWDARVLAGAPRPAVVVAQLGVWLLTEGEGGVPVVTTLAAPTQDFATLQWLDAEAGQPGEEFTVAMREQAVLPMTLAGGQRLLVNRRNVLDVDTLRTHPFSPYEPTPMDGFYPSNEPARALSPDGRQLVFVANRNVGMGYDYALVAVDYAANRASVVPFGRTATRFGSVEDFDPAWFAHYFEWRPAGEGVRLAVREGVVPRPWHGHASRDGSGRVEYRLRPVTRAMLDVLADFVVATQGATRTASDDPDRIDLRLGDDLLHAWYRPDDHELSLYADLGPRQAQAWARIERVAPAFDAELATRRHDALFGSLDGAP
jgi:hypothetical protein